MNDNQVPRIGYRSLMGGPRQATRFAVLRFNQGAGARGPE